MFFAGAARQAKLFLRLQGIRETRLYTIDSFSSIPVAAAMEIGAVLMVLMIIIKARGTAKLSFIFFLADVLLIGGLIFALKTRSTMYTALTFAAVGVLFVPYLIVVAADIPRKREEKRKEIEAMQALENSEQSTAEDDSAARDYYEATLKEDLEMNKEFIMKAAGAFMEANSMDTFLEYVNDRLTEKVKADGCVILLVDEFDNVLKVRSMKGAFPPPYKLPDDLPHKPLRVETNFRYAQFQLTDNIFGYVASSGDAAFVPDPDQNERIYQNGPEEFLACGSYIFIPLKSQDDVIGVVALSRNPGGDKFKAQDVEEAKLMTGAISTAIRPLFSFLEYAEHREQTKESDIASKFQKTLLPEKVPQVKDLGVGVWTSPAAGVCGDWYDVIPTRKDRISFVMADIAGKGMVSFVVMTMLRAMIRLIVNTPQSSGTILNWTNRGLCSDKANSDHFASVVLINYDPTSHVAQIASSGINPVLVYSVQTASIKRIDSTGGPLGVEKEADYKDIDTKLEKGDIIVTCTDGVIEALNGDGAQYSLDRLMSVLKKNSSLDGRGIANRVKDDIKKHCGSAPQYDDQSLLVIKILG